MSAPETEADKLPDDAPSIVAQKALMKAIWHCIVDASSMNVVMSGGEVNKATRNLRAAIEAEAREQYRQKLLASVEGLPDAYMTGAQGATPARLTGHISRAAVLALLQPPATTAPEVEP